MTQPLATFYKGWDKHNELVERAISGLSADQLSMQAAPHLWSVRTLASHIVSTRVWWFHEWMGEGGSEMARFIDYDEGEDSAGRSSSDLVDALRSTWSMVAASLSSWTEADLVAEFQRPERNAERGRPWRTRQYIVWHVAEHDVSHGGEISLTLGMHGLPGLDL